MKVYSENKIEAKKMREKGYSFLEIANILKIPRGTVYSWTSDVRLGEVAQARIAQRKTDGIKKSQEVARKKREDLAIELQRQALEDLSVVNLNRETARLLCAFLYWGEGAKTGSNVTFINSDPVMVSTFLQLLRYGYLIDEKKFRILVHIHEYHEEKEIINFWSKVTNLPIQQFNKSYIKPHTGKNTRQDYKGCVSIRYYDARIAKELFWLYTMFSKKIGPSFNGRTQLSKS